MNSQLVDTIIEAEWAMFATVANVGGPATCQMNPRAFRAVRGGQLDTWTDAIGQSYLKDLAAAKTAGRNLMTEKYARMMEYTHPMEYTAIAHHLPPLPLSVKGLVDALVEINIVWKEAAAQHFPALAHKGRALRATEDTAVETSFETYLRGELLTYSTNTLQLLYAHMLQLRDQGKNGVEMALHGQAVRSGFANLQEAEAAAAKG